ncbi:PD-(D/E)XK nuclease family protein [Ureibacillus acetophenoni]|uniref:PD-(D/E)XK nuclease superfamily protein n=1 Tax=Ureibacillus acetophenoni TaxID=614649 RepID=A0A285UMG7_9BACL|nr:PD-(D/E)XK nuclease family protein [Ureibacillus acetophenoni]SOC43095.1 PD-(D/E)XK nuclease superfamily protein [Ureibacillus acetophenoni]
MEIILGYWLDSKIYPDELHGETASVGKVFTGFHGLVNILEMQFGLSFPEIADSIRIAEWQATITKVDNGQKPYSNSFKTDSWNTARELKNRRDELVLAGWNPKIQRGGGKWIEAIAEIEIANIEHSHGFADRVCSLFKLLKQQFLPLSINKITIIDEDESLWENWVIEMIELLKLNGVTIEKMPLQPLDLPTPPVTDLQKIKAALYDSKIDVSNLELTNDGSFIILRSEQEWDAADFLISWLQQHGDDNTVLINNSNNLLLTELFHRRGLPTTEIQNYSKWRSALQVLPLTIETYWKPARVDRMMELLTLPISPIPRRLCTKLANSLAQEPGIGGEKWNDAIDNAVTEIEELWIAEGLNQIQVKKRIADLQEKIDLWINHEYYDPVEGIPCEIIEKICRKIGSWAFARNNFEPNSIFAQIYTITNELILGLRTLNIENINQLQLANILDSILGAGSKLDGYIAESASWTSVQHPGAIWGQANTVLWWDFTDHSSTNLHKWSDSERHFLQLHDILLSAPEQIRRRENLSWHNALRFAKEKVILFLPSKVRGEDVKAHPLLDEIRFALSKLNTEEHQLTIYAEELRKNENVKMIDITFKRHPITTQPIPGSIRQWTIPKQKVKLRDKESATSFESVLSCTLQWTLRYGANIRSSNALSLPNESVMLGNLGHAILERLIKENKFTNNIDIQQVTGEIFDNLVPKMAAMLLLPENQSLLRKVRRDLQKSMHQFATFLENTGVSITETEGIYSKQWKDNINFEGRLDLIGKTTSGRTMLFDAKWSRRPSNYKTRLQEGSIQLALYHWLLSTSEEDFIPVAYFMLQSGDFFAVADEDIPPQYHVESFSMNETLQTVRTEITKVTNSLINGVAVATGIEEEGAEESIFKPVCRFCEYQNLCGVGR